MKGFQWKDGYQGEHWFMWWRAPEGHELVGNDRYVVWDPKGEVDPTDAQPPWLVRKDRTIYAPKLLQYEALKKADLHGKFAELRNDEELLAFADRYGLLGREVSLVPVRGGNRIHGESLNRWHTELAAMGGVLQIWDWAQMSRDEKLEDIFSWLKNGKIVMRMRTRVFRVKFEPRVFPGRRPEAGYHTEVLSDGHGIAPALVQLVKPGEVTKLVRYYVCREVNKRLKGHVSPQLLPFEADIKDVHLFPENLLAALWVMFMREVTGQTKIERCPVCETRFEARGSRDKYCCHAHRQKAWEENQKAKKGKGGVVSEGPN